MIKKHTLAFSIGMIALLTNSTVIAMSSERWEGYKPYVGLDAQMRRMDFKGGYGDNLLRHNSPQGNLYGGIRLNDCVGMEAGYESTITKTRNATLYTGDIAAGSVVPAMASPVVFKSKMKIKGPHVDLVGFYSLREDFPVQLIGSVGVSFFKGTVERKTLQMGARAVPGRTRTLSQRKRVLRLMGGLEYKVNCHFGVRATVGLVKTGKLVIFTNDNLSGAFPEIKPKDSTVYGLGLFWVF